MIETQADERRPLKLMIDWGDGHPDRIPFPGPPLMGLELAARYVALRIPDHCKEWGEGTFAPEIDVPAPWAEPSKGVYMDRQLDYWPPGAAQSVPVRVRIGVPVPHPKYDWGSTITIEGFPNKPAFSVEMTGGDPVEALSYALSIAPIHVRLLVERGGRITRYGKENLQFPSMFSEPTRDWQLTLTEGGEPRTLTIRLGLPERLDERWDVLLSCTDCKTWKTGEKHIQADTWPEVIERAAAAVPAFLREHADQLGGGTLEEVRPSPPSPLCSIEPEAK
jgi:hypothetical protein